MKKSMLLVLIMCLLILTGCKGEDGDNGKVYSYLTWTNDVTAFDLSAIMFSQPSTFYINTKYEFIPEAVGRVYWKSSGTWYYYDTIIVSAQGGGSGSAELLIIPKDGNDGKDAIYMTQFSGSMIYQDFVRYENIAGSIDDQAISGIQITEEEREYAIEADIDEDNLPPIFQPRYQ